jgi:hypothetical protein
MQKRKIGSSLIIWTFSRVKAGNYRIWAFALCLLMAHSFTLLISDQRIATRIEIPPATANNSDDACRYEVQKVVSPEMPGILRSGMQFDNNPDGGDTPRHHPIPLTNGLRTGNCLILRI